MFMARRLQHPGVKEIIPIRPALCLAGKLDASDRMQLWQTSSSNLGGCTAISKSHVSLQFPPQYSSFDGCDAWNKARQLEIKPTT